MRKQLKIYVASSWRNDYQPLVVQRLRNAGYSVYDFKGSGDGWGTGVGGPGGFGWSEINPEWKERWIGNVPLYIEALYHYRAIEGFNRDTDALKECDACVMVMPCGLSAGMEMGWACGAGKPTAVFMPAIHEPDLMVKMANLVTDHFESVMDYLERIR
jgi:hypothetical protein